MQQSVQLLLRQRASCQLMHDAFFIGLLIFSEDDNTYLNINSDDYHMNLSAHDSNQHTLVVGPVPQLTDWPR